MSIFRLKLFAFPFAAAALLFAQYATQAAEQECSLEPNDLLESELAYQKRANRCEGIYRQKVSSRMNLRVVGYHENFPGFDPVSDKSVHLSPVARDLEGVLSIQLISLRQHDYYQMDTWDVEPGTGFDWELIIAKELPDPLQPFHIAAIACVGGCSQTPESGAVLVPVSFRSETGTAGLGRRTLFVMSDVELSSLSATLIIDGEAKFEKKRIGGRFIPAKRAVRIRLGDYSGRVAELSLFAESASGQQDYYAATLLLP